MLRTCDKKAPCQQYIHSNTLAKHEGTVHRHTMHHLYICFNKKKSDFFALSKCHFCFFEGHFWPPIISRPGSIMSLSPQQSAWLFASSALKRWWLTRWVGRFGEQLNTPRKTNMEPEIFNPWKRKIIWTKPSFSGSMLIFGGVKNFGWFGDTVGGRNPAPVEVGSLFHYLQGYVHLRWVQGFFHQQYQGLLYIEKFP